MRVVFPEPDLHVIIIIFISTFKFFVESNSLLLNNFNSYFIITFKKDFTIKA